MDWAAHRGMPGSVEELASKELKRLNMYSPMNEGVSVSLGSV